MLRSTSPNVLACLCLAVVCSSCLFAMSPTIKAGVVHGPKSLTYEVDSAFSGQLTHTIRIDNPTFERIESGTLFVPVIKNETGRHYVVIVNTNSTAGNPKFLSDRSGNTYAYWDDLVIDPGQSFVAQIEYSLLSFGTHIVMDLGKTANYDTSANLYKMFTQPEEMMESDAPEIESKAVSLIQDLDSIHDTVSRIYDFVTSYIHYARQEYERGALWALENKAGDCSEYSYLFVALCRAAGIPARIQTGFGFRNLDEETADGHMWAEYYLQDYGWIPVDPTWKLFDRIDEKHFSTMKSMPEITPYANYYFNYTRGPDNYKIKNTQQILLKSSSMNFLGSDLAEKTLKTVKMIDQARFAAKIERLLGMPLIFQNEAEEVDRAYATSEISLQNALENWAENLTTAQSYLFDAQANAQEALRAAWMLVAYGFTLFIGTSIAILSTTTILIRRHETNPERPVMTGKRHSTD